MRFDRCEICDFSELSELGSEYNVVANRTMKVRKHGDHMYCDDCYEEIKTTIQDYDKNGDSE